MLSIGRVGAGGARYYAGQVASNTLDYYTGSGEAQGVWLGAGAAAAGLAGEVDEKILAGLLAGTAPDATRLQGGPRGRLGGLDLTFSAPKSVSLLWALHPDLRVRRAVEEAHRAAVGDAIAYLESDVLAARRGRNGTRHVDVEGLTAASFTHRSSRTGDPQLHTHVVAVNMARDRAGRWSALDSRAIYRHAPAAGYVYQASMRYQLTATLGVTWGPVKSGQADLARLDRKTLEAFSNRRAQINAAMAERGTSSPKSARVATLDTRPPKSRHPAISSPGDTPAAGGRDTGRTEGLFERWARQGAVLGVDVAGLVGRPHQPRPEWSLLAWLAGADGLTANTSTFARRDVIKAVAQAHRQGARVADIQAIADRFLAGRDVTETTPPETARTAKRWTTLDMLTAENAVLAIAAQQNTRSHQPPGRARRAGVAGRQAIVSALAGRPSLTGEQRRLVEGICATPATVVCVVGKAGTGKTYALDAARAAWNATGVDVIGAALSARAAKELQSGSAIPSCTLARLLADIDTPQLRPRPGSVIVVDEAGMVGTRHLLRLAVAATANNWKLVLVGDPRQLPEIQAGGAYAALCRQGPTWNLTENRRQHLVWEREALDMLRDRRPAAAIGEYERHGRITAAPNAPAMRAALIADWYQHRNTGETTLIVATRRRVVDELNQAAQAMRVQAGELDPAGAVTVAGRTVMAGDDILCTRNDRRQGLHNGQQLTVTAIRPGDTIRTVDRDGIAHDIDWDYAQDGHVTLGYATTIHKAQGVTVDTALLAGDETLYAEAGYVALSRGRQTNLIYTINPTPSHQTAQLDGVNNFGGVGGTDGVHDALIEALAASRAQTLATNQINTHTRDASEDDISLAELLDTRRRLREHLARTVTNHTKPAGEPAPRNPDRSIDWDLDRSLDRAARRTGNVEPAHNRQQAESHAPADPVTRDRRWPGRHRSNVTELLAVETLIRRRVNTVRTRAVIDPPTAITELLGAPPDHPVSRQLWNRAAVAAALYNDIHGHPPGPSDRADDRAAARRDTTGRLGVRDVWRDQALRDVNDYLQHNLKHNLQHDTGLHL